MDGGGGGVRGRRLALPVVLAGRGLRGHSAQARGLAAPAPAPPSLARARAAPPRTSAPATLIAASSV